MAIYPDAIRVYAYVNSAWTEITTDVQEKITGQWGMGSSKELDRVADIGFMNLTLDNTTGKYSPNLPGALSGWKKGTPVKLVITHRDNDYIKFRGYVDTITITGGALGLRRVYATVRDWMVYAQRHPIVTPGIQTDKRADEALTTIIADMPIPPQDTDFAVGDEVFDTVFDATSSKTRAMTEFHKLALSEMGYIYPRKDRTNGETLTFENRLYRKGTDVLTVKSAPAANDGFLLKEDGDYLLTEAGDKIIIERAEDFTMEIDNNMQGVNVKYGENMINRMVITANPRKVDTSLTVLFSLGSSQVIGPGETISLRAIYFDPVGGGLVNTNPDTMEDPVATTDYQMWTNSDGTGTDKTTDLEVTAVYGSEGVTYTLYNDSTQTCYITKLQARGYGIYTYAQTQSIVEDDPSIQAYGYFSESIDQAYQQNTNLGKYQGSIIVANEKEPRTILNSVTLEANKSDAFMAGFLLFDVGDLVSVKEDTTGIDSYYYIQGVSFEITPAAPEGMTSGVIFYSWITKESQNLFSGTNGLSLVTVDFTGIGTSITKHPAINYGVLDYLNDLADTTTGFSISFWLYDPRTTSGSLIASGGGSGDAMWMIRSRGDGTLSSFIYGSERRMTTANIPASTWTHIGYVRTSSTVSFFVNGVSQTLGAFGSSTGPYSETNFEFNIGSGNTRTAKFGVNAYAAKVKMKDVRIYSGQKTAADFLNIYNEGAGGTGYLDNILFQGPCVKNSDLTYFTEHQLLPTDRLLDNVFGKSGIPEFKQLSDPDYPYTRLI